MDQGQPRKDDQPMDQQGQPINSDQQGQIIQQQNVMMQQQMQSMQMQMNDLNKLTEYKEMDKKLEEFEFGILVKQKYEIMEGITGCEFPNVYHVYKKDKMGKKKGEKQFKYKEKSTFCERMASGACKPYKMKVFNEQKLHEDEICMKCQKECFCSYMCCNRQYMLAYRVEGGNDNLLGMMYDVWSCCNLTFHIYDDESEVDGSKFGNLDYIVTAGRCQSYFWFGSCCPCKSCQEVAFEIQDGKTLEVVGQLLKHGRTCMSNAITGDDQDLFSVDFPKYSNWRQRAMLMNLSVFIDYVMFEDSSSEDRNGTAIGY